MTEHSMRLNKGERLDCSGPCKKTIEGPTVVQLIADPRDDEQIGEILCPECSDKRGE